MALPTATDRDPPASPSPSCPPTMPTQAGPPKRLRPSRVQTNLANPSSYLVAIPPSAVSNSSVTSSSLHDSPLMTPEQTVATTNNSSIQPSPDGLRGREMEQFPPPPFQLPESVISRRTSNNSLGQSIMSVPTPALHEVFGKEGKQGGGGLMRRLSNRVLGGAGRRRQSSVNPNSRDGSVGPGILRRRSDSNNTAPPDYGTNGVTDSDDDFAYEKDDVVSSFGWDGATTEASPISASASTLGSSTPSTLTTGPVVPMSLLKGNWVTKVAKGKRKRIYMVLDSESAKVSWDSRVPSKSVYIDDIKDIRSGEDARQYRMDVGVPEAEEGRFFSVIYAAPEKSKGKTLHLIAEDDESFFNWTETLEAISKHRQDMVISLMAFNDKAVRDYWHREMTRQFGDKPRSMSEELIDFPGIEKLCYKLHIHVASKTLHDRFKEAKICMLDEFGISKSDNTDPSRLNFAEFQEFVRLMKAREDVRAIYREISSDVEAGITYQEFIDFLRDVQGEDMSLDWRTTFAGFCRKGRSYELLLAENGEEELPRMSEAALASFLTSKDCLPVAKAPQSYELNRPMNEYYIASSHNTYLLGRQVKGESSVEGYTSALLRGCRCVEIDCWDGADGQPIVMHGNTLTTRISFREVINTINKYAFVKSNFPLWISLEVHCNPAQQEAMANIMKEVFGEKLVTELLPTAQTHLPTPSELKGRILIKAKKPQPWDDTKGIEAVGRKRGNSQPSPYLRPVVSGDSVISPTQTVPSSPALSACGSILSPRANKSRTLPRVNTIAEGEISSSSPSEGESEGDPSRRSTSKIIRALGSLAVYAMGIKFAGFDSADAKAFNHILSFKEGTFAKNSQPLERKMAMFLHNMRFLMRVYPNQFRFTSSNFDPLIYWKRGVQMAALNWQTFDLGMQLNQAMFDGGTDQSGYVLKPPELREIQVRPILPGEWAGKRERSVVNFSIDVISAQQLMRPSTLGERRTVDPYVEVEVFVPDDKRSKPQPNPGLMQIKDTLLKFRTKIVKGNGFNPIFDNKFNFSVTTKYPELVFVRWSVKLSEGGNYSDPKPMATFTAKLGSLRQGYRTLPLLNANGDQFLFSTLFCRIKKEPTTRVLVPYPEDAVENANKLKSLGGRVFSRSSNQSPKSSIDSGPSWSSTTGYAE